MTGGVAVEMAFGAGGVRSYTDAMTIILEEPAVAGTELCQGYMLTPRERSLGEINGRRAGSQEMVRAKIINGGEDGVGMDLIESGFVVVLRENTIGEKWSDDVFVFRMQRVLHLSRAWVGSDDEVGAVFLAESGRQALGAEHVGVWLHGKLHHLLVQVVDGRGANAPSDHAQRRVLDHLEAVEGRRRRVGGPDRCGVVNCGFDKALEGHFKHLFRGTPGGPGGGFQDRQF